jgi:hypothetical protein
MQDALISPKIWKVNDSETYGNRVRCCQLLEALRNTIKGHKSLLEDGMIFHQDVSENNISNKPEPVSQIRHSMNTFDAYTRLQQLPHSIAEIAERMRTRPLYRRRRLLHHDITKNISPSA